MSVDLRSRIDSSQRAIEPEAFFGDDLPAALDANAATIGPAVRWLDPRPLTVEVDRSVWTLVRADDRVEVQRGESGGGSRVHLAREQFDQLVNDQQTFMGFWSSGRLDQPTGRLGDALDWWLVLRAALDGAPIYMPGTINFTTRDGAPLDLQRSFRGDDDRREMRHFLEQAGYLHIEGVFTENEMALVSAEMDRAAFRYSPGDGRSWWARTAGGQQRLVRMQAFDEHSPAAAALVDDTRFLDLAEIPGDGHRFGARDTRIEALFKPIGVVEGISDVPWHKDCSLGRHSYECCGITVGISVTGADAVSGQLRVRAGSHRALVWPALEQPRCDLPTIDLPTRTGDVTVHLSCTLHMAQPPVERERRVMYSGFSLPPLDAAAAAEGRARLRAVREAAPVTVSQPPGYTG
jgi:Phytanoyl-CoA dioxygenase (PhyH)